MRKVILSLVLLLLLVIPVDAAELTAPTVPSYAEDFMVSEPENLSEGIRQILKEL